MMSMNEQDKINDLSSFEDENDVKLEVGTQLEILAEDYDVVNCVVTRFDRQANKFWITRNGNTVEEQGCVFRCQTPSDGEDEDEY